MASFLQARGGSGLLHIHNPYLKVVNGRKVLLTLDFQCPKANQERPDSNDSNSYMNPDQVCILRYRLPTLLSERSIARRPTLSKTLLVGADAVPLQLAIPSPKVVNY